MCHCEGIPATVTELTEQPTHNTPVSGCSIDSFSYSEPETLGLVQLLLLREQCLAAPLLADEVDDERDHEQQPLREYGPIVIQTNYP